MTQAGTDLPSPTTPIKHLYLVDASWFIFRAFHAPADRVLTRSDGTPINAVFIFTRMLMKILENLEADHIGIVFDSEAKTFRAEISPDYKANRPEPPEELLQQLPLVREATRAFNLDCIEVPGYEADDLIATYTRKALEAGADVTIVSADKDLMQLVSDRVRMYDFFKNRYLGPAEVQEKFGVPPSKVVDVQALAGDSIDNIPGVPGIGMKTAAQLINEYGDLDSLLQHASEVKQKKRRELLLAYADQARLSRELVRLHDDVPIDLPVERLVRRPIDTEALLRFLREQEFKSIIAAIQSRANLAGGAPNAGGPSQRSHSPGQSHQYELVQSLTRLRDWVSRIRNQGVVAIDTETTSLDQSRAKLVGLSLSIEPFQACYIPLAHIHPDSSNQLAQSSFLDSAHDHEERNPPSQIPMDQALETLAPLLNDPAILKVGHNIKYDLVVLSHYGLTVTPIDDTMLLSYVLEGGSHGHSLDETAQVYLGYTTLTYKEVAGSGKSQVTFDRVPLEKALAYAAEDADVTTRLHRTLKPRLVMERMTTVYETLERPLVPVLADMEVKGIKVDSAELRRISAEFTQRLSALESEIHRLAGRPFNVGSPKQLGEILFEELGLEGGQKGKSGTFATGAGVLEALAAQGHPLPDRVLQWRHLDKLKSTYADALIHQINPKTKRVHTSFSMAAASTGRLSSSDPNLQNIPIRTEEGRRIRRAFVAEKGHVLLSLDYSQIELRLLAHIADIEVLKQAFREGQDIHALTASQIFGVPVDGLDAAMRRKAKAINFGIIYGISPFGLARQLGVEQNEAAAYIQAYFERYPGIEAYMERTKQFCRDHGYVQTVFGRRCHIQAIRDKNPARRNFAERAAINAPIQGSAADILKRAMIRVPAALEQAELTGRAHMLLTVHDELLFEVEEALVQPTSEVIKRVMELAPLPALQLSVPLTVDVGHGHSWDDAH